MPAFDKIVVVTRKTALEELVERFNTREQARFYIEHLGQSFADYQAAHDTYHAALKRLKAALPDGLRSQFVERGFLPTFLFGPRDLVIALGPDGLVVNAAKYLEGQPLVGVNPDPSRIDGILVPWSLDSAQAALARVLTGIATVEPVTMAQATLSDGQTLLAVNDLFVGQKTHVSARYFLRWREFEERQSSSGIIVSTGAGSTGWLRSILAGAAGVVEGHCEADDATRGLRDDYRFAPGSDHLWFHVREPFASRASQAELVCGQIEAGEALQVVSQMPQNGVIFSDGVESDYLQFDSGTTATIGLADRKLQLVVPTGWGQDATHTGVQ
ncbi:MAG: hypothetical protein U0746_14825 [Gemmataceae bacterium]